MSYPKTEFWVVSAERADRSARLNARYTIALRMEAERAGFFARWVTGYWQGKRENTTILGLGTETLALANFAKEAMARYGQEAVIHVGGTGRAILHEANGNTSDLGQWTEVSQSTAAIQPGFTYDHIADRYYVAVLEGKEV